MLHVLPGLGAPAVLLLRKAPSSWVKGPPQAPFQPRRYHRIFEIEPVGFDVDGAEALPPAVVTKPDELLDRQSARAALGIDDDGPCTLVFQAGLPDETRALLGLVPAGSRAHVITATDENAPFPMAHLLRAGDACVTGAGYNAVWESVWLGTQKTTKFQVFPRRIDDQAWRMGAVGSVQMRENGGDVLVSALRAG